MVRFLILIILFRILLEVSYVEVVSQSFSYQGFNFNFNISNYIISWLLFFFGLFTVRDRLKKVSDYFFLTSLLGVIIPLSVLYAYDYERNIFPILVTELALLFIYFITITNFISFKGISIFKYGKHISILICTCFVLFLVVWYKLKGVSFNLDLQKVYEFRRDNKELASFGILAYINNWTYQIFNMFLFSFSLILFSSSAFSIASNLILLFSSALISLNCIILFSIF